MSSLKYCDYPAIGRGAKQLLQTDSALMAITNLLSSLGFKMIGSTAEEWSALYEESHIY